MPGAIDKIVIANRSAMQAKYTANSYLSVQAALQRLIVSDSGKGLQTLVLYIDDPAQMAAYGGTAVASAADERGAKAAVDAVVNALAPDYILLLDGPDVVPHIALSAIQGLNDGDLNIPSDLPYASSAGWSRQASNYLAITRVVGRLPAAEGDPNADHIIHLIDAAANHHPQPLANFQKPFGMSADVWRVSTQISLATTFGPGTSLYLSPFDTHPNIDNDLVRLSHFINCHGAQADANFYGQLGASYPVAIESLKVGPKISDGSVAAVECCFGAELYNHTQIGIDQPICISYMLNGAIAYLGSTNIAYGPAASNGQADLLTQYFLQEILTGASTGRALLMARQKFVQGQVMADPTNLKTIAQFLLLGDPSAHPCDTNQIDAQVVSSETTETQAKSILRRFSEQNALDPEQNRKLRRLALKGIGKAIGASATRPGQAVEMSQTMQMQLAELAQSLNLDPAQMTMLTVSGGVMYRSAVKTVNMDRRVAVVVDRKEIIDGGPSHSVKIMVSHIINGRIVRSEVSECR